MHKLPKSCNYNNPVVIEQLAQHKHLVSPATEVSKCQKKQQPPSHQRAGSVCCQGCPSTDTRQRQQPGSRWGTTRALLCSSKAHFNPSREHSLSKNNCYFSLQTIWAPYKHFLPRKKKKISPCLLILAAWVRDVNKQSHPQNIFRRNTAGSTMLHQRHC